MTSKPRMRALSAAERDATATELLSRVGELAELNIFATLVRHPRLFKRWVPYGGALLNGSLPARERELLILRTAHRCSCPYEWKHHEVIAAAAGMSPDEIAGVRTGPERPGWSAFEVALLRAADELHDNQHITDSTWKALAQRYDDQHLIEVPMLVGHYHAVAFTLNSLGVELENEYR